MTDPTKPAARPSDAPGTDLNEELKNLTRGAVGTRRLMAEHKQLLSRVGSLEEENARLRAAVEAEDAIRELLGKIETLEQEKNALLRDFRAAEAKTSGFDTRFAELEAELSQLANLFVANNCLHSTLSLRAVGRRVTEVLEQLIGVAAYVLYISDPQTEALKEVSKFGLSADEDSATALSVAEDVIRSGKARITGSSDTSQGTLANPAALLPLVVDEQTVGLICIVRTLDHKDRFATVDFELFRLLGQHMGLALMGAGLYSQADRKLPAPATFSGMNR